MGWEPRGRTGRPYYYKKSRDEEGRVRSAYVGAGPVAVAVAELDALARADRDWHRTALSVLEADVDRADAAVRSTTTAVGSELSAALEAAGYRYHRGEWRRPRGAGPRADGVPGASGSRGSRGETRTAPPATPASSGEGDAP